MMERKYAFGPFQFPKPLRNAATRIDALRACSLYL
jgi:hypothetical protein